MQSVICACLVPTGLPCNTRTHMHTQLLHTHTHTHTQGGPGAASQVLVQSAYHTGRGVTQGRTLSPYSGPASMGVTRPEDARVAIRANPGDLVKMAIPPPPTHTQHCRCSRSVGMLDLAVWACLELIPWHTHTHIHTTLLQYKQSCERAVWQPMLWSGFTEWASHMHMHLIFLLCE